MLEQIQRDLFALGARLADPGAQDRRPRDEGRGHRRRYQHGSKAGSTRSNRSCRRCGASSSPAACRAGRRPARRAHGLPPRRARAWSRSGADAVEPELLIYVNRLSDLLFVMARAANRRAGRAGNRVVSALVRDERSRTELGDGVRLLRAARPRALRELSGRVAAAARRACVRTSPRSTRSRAGPTTSPTSRASPPAERLRLLDDWRAPAPRPPDATAGQTARRRRTTLHFPRARRTRSRDARSAASALRGSAQRVPAGRRRRRATRRGTTCSTTAAARRIRSAGSCCASPAYDDAAARRRSRTPSARRCSSPTSGRTWRSTGAAAASTCRSRIATAPARATRTSTRGRMTPEWRAALRAGGRRGRASSSTPAGPSATRVARPAALGAAADLARRRRGFSTSSRRPASTSSTTVRR